MQMRAAASVLVLAAVTAGCSIHWPGRARQEPASVAVQELLIGPAAGSATAAPAVAQYWDRNTLLVDMSGVSGSGALTLRPVQGNGWPIRLEFRVQPGSIESLEVRGEQRMVFAVPAHGNAVSLPLGPGLYSPRTAAITVQWSAAGDSVR
jgi:hypothetical protein